MTLQELGQAIREKRVAANLSIENVSGRIKISVRILKSIEEGSFTDLPHAVYTKSFIRTFGLLVGYDPLELNAHLDELFPQESLNETRNEPGPRTRILKVPSNNSRNIAILLIFACIISLIVAGGWYVAKNYGDVIFNFVKMPFSALTAPSSDSKQNEGQQSALQSATPALFHNGSVSFSQGDALSPPVGVPHPPSTENVHTGVPDGKARIEAPQTHSVTAAAPASAGVDASGAINSKRQLRIIAEEPCWITFQADGVKGREYTMQPQEILVIIYENTLEIVFGNAGGVTMVHNGQDIGKPGRSGQRVAMRFPRLRE
ncbi:MAG: DUF4115 domain-containing protein [Desulfovibrio sp.]|jgi:cytoskeleton protein RodZ|nr:DUF4115 domain-containing protein [Desulfovibrio sp.]